jgi:hypothetical protein
MPKTNYVARLEGKIVGKRSTAARTYTHALVVQRDEEIARQRAYQYTSTDSDSSNFEYSSFIAAQHAGVPCQPRGWTITTTFKAEQIADAQAEVAGGFDAYVRRLRERAIATFEENKTAGHFDPHVATWCGRPDLAEKAISNFTGPHTKFVAIVAAEKA